MKKKERKGKGRERKGREEKKRKSVIVLTIMTFFTEVKIIANLT